MQHSLPVRCGVSDAVWKKLEPHLPGREGIRGGLAQDNRRFIEAVFWVMRTGAAWRDLPPHFGGWSNTHRRFIRWRDHGVWERLLEILIDEPDFDWLLRGDGQGQAGSQAARGGKPKPSRVKGTSTQKCLWPLVRMICRSGPLLHKAQQRFVLRQAFD